MFRWHVHLGLVLLTPFLCVALHYASTSTERVVTGMSFTSFSGAPLWVAWQGRQGMAVWLSLLYGCQQPLLPAVATLPRGV